MKALSNQQLIDAVYTRLTQDDDMDTFRNRLLVAIGGRLREEGCPSLKYTDEISGMRWVFKDRRKK